MIGILNCIEIDSKYLKKDKEEIFKKKAMEVNDLIFDLKNNLKKEKKRKADFFKQIDKDKKENKKRKHSVMDPA